MEKLCTHVKQNKIDFDYLPNIVTKNTTFCNSKVCNEVIFLNLGFAKNAEKSFGISLRKGRKEIHKLQSWH